MLIMTLAIVAAQYVPPPTVVGQPSLPRQSAQEAIYQYEMCVRNYSARLGRSSSDPVGVVVAAAEAACDDKWRQARTTWWASDERYLSVYGRGLKIRLAGISHPRGTEFGDQAPRRVVASTSCQEQAYRPFRRSTRPTRRQ
jgi:hypothetical protein